MLRDLDELVLQCRDERARAYIREAVSCYRGGAYRAAIVSTWIAVAFDVIDKIRELALSGDKQAEQLQEEFERIRASGNVPRALTFERTLLEVARDTFELISPIEYSNLARLQEDRNRCAHPSMASDMEIFSPPGELARLHLRVAVEHLLTHEPAQGKAALERLLNTVSSPYFPENPAQAFVVLAKSPLQKARESLVRNFVLVILKRLLNPDEKGDYPAQRRLMAALKAVRQIHPDKIEEIYAAELPLLFGRLDGAPAFLVLLELVKDDPSIWESLNAGQQMTLKSFVENLPSAEMFYINSLLTLGPVKAEAARRVKKLTLNEATDMIPWDLHPLLRQQYISCYARAHSGQEANQWATEIEHYYDDFTLKEIALIFSSAASNTCIRESSRLPMLIGKFRKSKVMTAEEFDNLIVSNALRDYVQPIEL